MTQAIFQARQRFVNRFADLLSSVRTAKSASAKLRFAVRSAASETGTAVRSAARNRLTVLLDVIQHFFCQFILKVEDVILVARHVGGLENLARLHLDPPGHETQPPSGLLV